jgi:PAS domain S-box-containing protein
MVDYYYLALNLLSLICLGMASSEWWYNFRSENERLLAALAGLTVTQAILTISWRLGWPAYLNAALELTGALLLLRIVTWPDTSNVKQVRLMTLGVMILLIFGFAALVAFDQLALWELGRVGVACLGLAVTVWQRESGQPIRAASFAALFLGAALDMLGLANTGRIFILMAYVAMTGTLYSDITADLRSYAQELKFLSEEALHQTREQLFLLEASQALGSFSDLTDMLDQVVRSISMAIGADQVVVVLLQGSEAAQEEIVVAAGHNPSRSGRSSVVTEPLPLKDYALLEHAIKHRRHVLLEEVQDVPAMASLYALWDSSPAGPILIIPLTLQDKVLGALIAANPQSKRPLTRREVRLCQGLAMQVAAAVENVTLYEAIEAQARRLTDMLAVREAEASQQQAILESIAEGVVVSDAQGKVILANAAAERILELPRRQILGRPIGTIYGAFVSSEPVEELAIALSRRGEPLPTFFEQDGLIVRGILSPVRTLDGDWLGMVAVFRDATKEVEADRAKSEFIAAISHELRTPLTAIKGYTELLIMSVAGDVTPDQRRFLDIIRVNADRMVELVNNVIHIAGLERDAVQLNLRQVDVREIIKEALEAIRPLATARQLTLRVELQRELPLLEADSPRLRQILDNLLSNACHFTYPGGRITVRAWAQRDVTQPGPQVYIIIAVADTGVGIPPEEQERIFERFYRADNPLQMEAGGMGVGLAVVKSLVEAHGGRVWVESHVGQGSVFHIALPVEREHVLRV